MNFNRKTFDKVTNKLEMKIRNGKHINARLYVDDKLIISTSYSHSKEPPIGTLNAIKKQFYLDTDDFNELIKCTMTKDQYIRHLKNIGQV